MDLQQYKYRRNFPYNDTIKEDSAEMLSENKSSVTFTSTRPNFKGEVDYNQMKAHGFNKRKSLFSNQQFDEQGNDPEFDMKSENFIRNYSNRQERNQIEYQYRNKRELADFNKQSSEKYIKSSQKINEFRTKKVKKKRSNPKMSGPDRKHTFVELTELEDEVFFQPSQRNSHQNEQEGTYDFKDQKSRDPSENFPDQEFRKFKKLKAENTIFNLLHRAYCSKQIAAFYLLWDNVQYSILADIETPFKRRLFKIFQILKRLPAKSFKRRAKRSKRNLRKHDYVQNDYQEESRNYYENTSMTGASNYQADTNIYVESEFTSLGGSDKNIQRDLVFPNKKNERNYLATQHFKNKSNNFLKKKGNHTRNVQSGEYQNDIQEREKINEFVFSKKGKKRKMEKIKKEDQKTKQKNMMRKLRETLEQEEIEVINKTHFSKGVQKKPNFNRISKNSEKNFSFSNNSLEPEFGTFGVKTHKVNFFKKNNLKNIFEEDKQFPEESKSEKKSAIARIFYLLSKRFQDTRYKNFFLDQVEVLVYNHGIRDPKIMNILKNLDLRFDINDLCPEESEREDENREISVMEKQLKMQRKIEKQYTKENMKKLERVMMLFRADNLFAPLIRHFIFKKMSFNRHFFVNLRWFSKLAPFRKLHQCVQKRVKINQRAVFSQILFYIKPNLRLLLLMFAISKVKQRHIVDAFRRIYAFYYERLKQQQKEQEMKSKYFLANNFRQ